MARPQWKGWLDLSVPELKQRFIRWIGTLSGQYEVDLQPRRKTRTNQQLRWWWPCVCTPLYEFLKDQDYDIVCVEDAHDLLRGKFLRTPLITDPTTGEVLEWRIKHTRELTPAEFSDFAEKSRDWLLDTFGIVTMSPNEFEPQEAETSAGK